MTNVNINKIHEGRLNTSNNSDGAKSLAKKIRSQISPAMTDLIVKELGSDIFVEYSEDGRRYTQLNSKDHSLHNLCKRYLDALFTERSSPSSRKRPVSGSSHLSQMRPHSNGRSPLNASSDSSTPRLINRHSHSEPSTPPLSPHTSINTEADRITSTFRRLADKNQQLERQVEQNGRTIQALRDSVRRTEAERDSFQKKLQASQEELNEDLRTLKEENHRLSEQNTTLQSSQQEQEDEFESTRNSLQETLGQAVEERDALAQTAEELQERLKYERTHWNQARNELQVSLQGVTNRLEESESRVQETAAQLQELTERHAKEKDELVSKLETNERQIDDNNQQVRELTHTVNELRVQKDKATTRANRLENTLRKEVQLSNQLTERVQDLTNQLKQNKAQNKRAQRAEAVASRQIREQQEQMAKIQQEMQALRDQNSALHGRVATLTTEKGQVSQLLKNETLKLSAAGVRIADLVKECDTANTYLDWHKQEIVFLNSKLEELRSELRKAEKDNRSLSITNDYYKDRLQRELEQSDNAIERLENQVTQFLTLSNFHAQSHEDALHQIDELNLQLKLEKNKVLRREKELEKLTEEYLHELARQKNESLLPLENNGEYSAKSPEEELEALLNDFDENSAAPAEADAAS